MKNDWKEVWRAASEEMPVIAEKKLVGKWLAEDIGGGGVVDNSQSTLEIGEDGTVSGNTAVNRYGGKAKIVGQKIEFGSISTTRRAGPPALMDQESKFTKELANVASFRIDDNGLLYLLNATGKEVVRFSKKSD